MMTILILGSILSVTMIANTIILNNLSMNIVQVGATKAFFASESGVERGLWEIRKDAFDFTLPIPCDTVTNKKIRFETSGCDTIGDLYILTGNNSKFSLEYKMEVIDATTTITSFGTYGDTARNTQIEY